MVQDMTSYPWCTVGKVFVGYPKGEGSISENLGSGVFLGPKIMLTTSQIIPWGKKTSFMRFIPACNDTKNTSNPAGPSGSSWISEVYGVESFGDQVDGFD